MSKTTTVFVSPCGNDHWSGLRPEPAEDGADGGMLVVDGEEVAGTGAGAGAGKRAATSSISKSLFEKTERAGCLHPALFIPVRLLLLVCSEVSRVCDDPA